jgi:hypothetical protein
MALVRDVGSAVLFGMNHQWLQHRLQLVVLAQVDARERISTASASRRCARADGRDLCQAVNSLIAEGWIKGPAVTPYRMPQRGSLQLTAAGRRRLTDEGCQSILA